VIRVVVPTLNGLDTPDEVWLDDVGGGQVSLIYRPGPGLPPAEHTGIGLLLQEFADDGHEVIRKYFTSDAALARASTSQVAIKCSSTRGGVQIGLWGLRLHSNDRHAPLARVSAGSTRR
jgi:hypothetical protein